MTRIDLFKKILEVQGADVECGVHKGNSLFLYNHLSTILEPYNFNRKIIGFDIFEGFRSISKKDSDSITKDDFLIRVLNYFLSELNYRIQIKR